MLVQPYVTEAEHLLSCHAAFDIWGLFPCGQCSAGGCKPSAFLTFSARTSLLGFISTLLPYVPLIQALSTFPTILPGKSPYSTQPESPSVLFASLRHWLLLLGWYPVFWNIFFSYSGCLLNAWRKYFTLVKSANFETRLF